jgi:hypothetical protein
MYRTEDFNAYSVRTNNSEESQMEVHEQVITSNRFSVLDNRNEVEEETEDQPHGRRLGRGRANMNHNWPIKGRGRAKRNLSNCSTSPQQHKTRKLHISATQSNSISEQFNDAHTPTPHDESLEPNCSKEQPISNSTMTQESDIFPDEEFW